MKVAPAVAEVLGVVDDAAGSHTEGYGEVLSVAHAPAAAPGVGVVIHDLPSVPAVPNFRNAHAKIRERPPDERVQSPPDGYE